MKQELYDLKIVFEQGNPKVKNYKEFKSRTLENVVYWIKQYQKWKDIIYFEIKQL